MNNSRDKNSASRGREDGEMVLLFTHSARPCILAFDTLLFLALSELILELAKLLLTKAGRTYSHEQKKITTRC
ncbi:hypothetical protein RRG08_046346 [Elysia crispata]|uniref:Uncharacterized protein n=1 Tax=Elysia crispata TaxID=231223 RepID=A0AAE1A4W4_9GAST|nr:hypothetical protein RRG08_046346 [Elysia crispata]